MLNIRGGRSFFALLPVFVLLATLPPAASGDELASGNSQIALAGPAAAGRDPRFGLNQAWENGAAADTAGAGWSRLTFWWSALQPKGTQDWNTFATDNDSYIDAELKRGRELAGVVLNTPNWAGTGSPTSIPKNLYMPWDSPQNYWGVFMKQLANSTRAK